MNKLFTRIGVAFAGIAMAIGVGVAVGQSPRAVERVDAAGEVTAEETTNDLQSANGWTVSSGSNIGSIVTSFELDDVITISTSGEANCGSIWGSTTKDWRLYQNKSGNVTATASTGYKILSVKYIYTNSNNGTLKDGDTTVASAATVTVNGSSKTLTVGNTGSATNGQVRITKFTVVYASESAATLESVSVDAAPTKKSYIEGEIFNPAGATFTAHYSDKSTTTISSNEITWANSGIMFDGQTSIVGTYSSVDFEVDNLTVSKKEVTALSTVAAANDDQTTLYRIEGIVTEFKNTTYGNLYLGISVGGGNVVYGYGLSADTTRLSYSNNNYTMSSSGGGWSTNPVTKDVKVGDKLAVLGYVTSYNSTKEFCGVVREVVTEGLQSITATPSVTEYVVGQSVTSSDVSIVATYALAGNVNVDFDDCTVSPASFTTSGTIEVTISYTDENSTTKTSSYNVTVSPRTLTGIVIKTNPTKMSFAAGQTFSSAGLVITASYDDDLGDADFSSGFTTDYDGHKFTSSEAGTVKITVTFGSKTTSYNVTVTVPTGALGLGGRFFIYTANGALDAGEITTSPAKVNLADAKAWDFEIVGNDTYTISRTVNSTKYYLVCATNGASGSNTSIRAAENGTVSSTTYNIEWIVTSVEGGYTLQTDNESAKNRWLHDYCKTTTNDWRGYNSDTAQDASSVLTLTEEKDVFASNFLNTFTEGCNSSGSYDNSKMNWTSASTQFGTLTTDNQNVFKNATYTKTGTGSDTVVTPGEGVASNVANVVAKYDYIVGKYGTSTFADFMQREPAPISGGAATFGLPSETNTTATFIAVIAAVSTLAIGGFFFLRKRKIG